MRARDRKTVARAVMVLLSGSLAAIAIAPTLMAASYSWVEHAVSAAAGQGVQNAWLTRLGFLLLALAVLLLAGIAGERWGIWGRSTLRVYGVLVIAAAAFSQSHWEDMPFNTLVDFLHSAAAFGTAITFTVGILIVIFRRGPNLGWIRAVDSVVLTAALVIPLIMFYARDVAGAAERVMFLIGYSWFAMEAWLMAASNRTG